MIRFPKMHIAESVLNRIQNTLEGIGPLSMPTPEPVVPDPTATGLGIDAALASPMGQASAEPGMEEQTSDDATAASLSGQAPIDAVVTDNIAL